MRDDCAYASPVRIEVRQAARSRPCGESDGTPRAMSSAPRFAYPRPSGRNSSLFLAIFSVGYDALLTMISCAVIVMWIACLYASISIDPSSLRNLVRLIDARLQLVSSRNMNSLQGLLALIRLVAADVCQSLMVVSYCMPGSPHCHADSAISRISSRALTVLRMRFESVTARRCQSRSSATARMNSSVTRTELLLFWKKTEEYASPVKAL